MARPVDVSPNGDHFNLGQCTRFASASCHDDAVDSGTNDHSETNNNHGSRDNDHNNNDNHHDVAADLDEHNNDDNNHQFDVDIDNNYVIDDNHTQSIGRLTANLPFSRPS